MSVPGAAGIVFAEPVQREIWATLRAVNDAWTQGHPDDLADYFHAQMVAVTPVDRLRRDGAVACVAGWKSFADAAQAFDATNIVLNATVAANATRAKVRDALAATRDFSGVSGAKPGRFPFP